MNRLLSFFMMVLLMSSFFAAGNAYGQEVTLLGSWSFGDTKAKETGSNRLLVVAVTGEISVMNNLTDISLTYGGQAMNKVVFESIGTTGFGNFSYIFTLNEAGIAAADETGTLVPTWTTTAPAGFDIFSAFYSNVDQTTSVSDTSEFNLNSTLITAPAVNAALGDVVLMSVATAGQPRTPTYTTGFNEILKNPTGQSWGSGIIAFKDGDGTEVIPSITNSNSERCALTAIVLKKAKVLVKTPVVLLDSWTAGTTKPKAAGTKRLLVAMVTGEISVMNNLTDISLTYGGQAMNKVVSESIGTTAFGNFSYIFILDEAGINAADETGTLEPTWTTTAPAGFDIFSAFYDKVDQTTPVSDTSEFNLNGTLITAPAVAAAFGDVVLMSVATAGQPRTPTYTTGFTEVLKNPNSQSWGSGIIAFKDGDGSEVIPSITNSNSERCALTAIVLMQGEEEGVPPTYYNLTVTAPTGGTVKIDPNRVKYLEGAVVKVTATPNFGYIFVNWTDSLNTVVADTSILMNSNKVITANFAEKTNFFKLTTNAVNGTIIITPNDGFYDGGTVVEVQAIPDFGYYFVNWTDSLNTDVADTSILMNSIKTITANFAEKTKYTLTTEVSNGSVFLNPAGGTYYEGVEVTLIAQTNVGYKFLGWSGDLSGTETPITIVMDANKVVTAVIEEIAAYTVTVSGTNGIVSVSPFKETYNPDEAVVLIALADEGYRFLDWSGDLAGTENPTAIFMNSDKNIIANFEVIPPSYTLSTTAANGTITLEPAGGTYEEGTSVTVTVTPDDKYLFVEWTGDLSGTVNPKTITVNSDMSITATFIVDVTGINNLAGISGNSKLEQNYPNPFSATTTISYQLNRASHVNLSVYNVLGEKIAILVNANHAAGHYTVDWSPVDKNGSQLANGIYIYRLAIDNKPVQFKKATLSR